jgi:hypothetical protein
VEWVQFRLSLAPHFSEVIPMLPETFFRFNGFMRKIVETIARLMSVE